MNALPQIKEGVQKEFFSMYTLRQAQCDILIIN